MRKDFAERNRERMVKAIAHEETDRPPVFLLINAPFCSYYSGISSKEYYEEPKKMLNAQLKVRKRFYNLTPVWADGGVVVEASALGGEVHWDTAGNPQVKPFLKDIEDIDKLEIPDPKKDGWIPNQIKTYEYMLNNVEKSVKIGFGNLVIGPVTVAGMIRGMSNFLIDLYKNPDAAYKLLKICNETVKIWGEKQEELTGESEHGTFMGDDAASFLTPKQFREFVLPLYKDFYKSFPNSCKWYHNDMDATHLLELLVESGVEVFNPSYDLDLVSSKRRVGDKICFLGNIPPSEVLREGTAETVKKSCKNLIRDMIKEGKSGFILSTGGFINFGTPAKNIDAMIASVDKPL
jgi:uroporphyrinogen-III decarboxylase